MNRASELRRMVLTELADVHTCIPGTIVSYDGSTAVVRPALSKALANGDELPPPDIFRVPVCWPSGDVAGAQALISVPLKVGDPVLLHFSERAIENWLSGTDGMPGDPRMFDLTDAFATPVCRPGTQQADTTNLSIGYGGALITIAPDGRVAVTTQQQVAITAGGGVAITGDVTVEGRIDAAGDVVGGGVSLINHITTGVTPGSGVSGPPQK